MSANEMIGLDGGKMMTELATVAITQAVKTGWNKVKKFFKDLDAKDSITYGDAYSKYLQNTYDRNSKIKTLIYRRVPQNLYSFYECIGVRYKKNIIDTSNIQNLLNINNKLIITGSGGIGKSILLKHLFLTTIENSDYIPVLIELRKFNNLELKEISMYDAIYQSLCDNGFKLEDEYYSYSLEEGGYVILLDGLDEVNREKINRVSEEILIFSGRYNKNKFIVSSRPMDLFIGWNDFHEMSACNLTKKQALSLIKKIEFNEPAKSIFYKALNNNLFNRYHSFASNPLLLTIMLLTFNNHASIPEKLNDFYEEAFATLFNMHDATKDCYVRDIRSRLGCEDFKKVFAYICFKSYFKSEFEFSEARLREYIQQARDKFDKTFFTVNDFQEDLVLSVCMLVKDGLNYRFTHRSFQEYFAAWYTCKLTDDIQTKLLTSWLTESDAAMADEYLDMLYNLQPEKVNKIVLCPGIKAVKQIYDQEDFSCRFLRKLFVGIFVYKKHYEKVGVAKQRAAITFVVGNHYLCNTIRLTCRLNQYSDTHQRLEMGEKEQVADKLIKHNDRDTKLWRFDEVLSIVSEDELVSCMKSLNDQVRFCFQIYEKYNEKPASKKRKVLSIIDEL